MKKQYITPRQAVLSLQLQGILAASITSTLDGENPATGPARAPGLFDDEPIFGE